MPRLTSFDEIYETLMAIITASTGRPCWRHYGLQTHPKVPHATIKLHSGTGLEKPQKTQFELASPGPNGETILDVYWNESLIRTDVDFWSSKTNDSHLDAATRLRSSLYDYKRMFDLFTISAVSGGIKLTDLSFVTAEDIVQRSRLSFTLAANIAAPIPLDMLGQWEITSQSIAIIHVRQDGVETEISIPITKPVS